MQRSLRSVFLGLLVAVLCTLTVADDPQRPGRPHIVVRAHGPSPDTRAAQFIVRYGLTRDDLYWIGQLPGITRAVPVRSFPRTLWAGENSTEGMLTGTTAAYGKAHGVAMARGGWISEKDEAARQNVIILSSRMAEELFGADSPLGERVLMSGEYFTVVGVMKRDARAAGDVFIPLATLYAVIGDTVLSFGQGRSRGEQVELDRIEIWLDESRQPKAFAQAVRRVLAKMHQKEDYSIIVN